MAGVGGRKGGHGGGAKQRPAAGRGEEPESCIPPADVISRQEQHDVRGGLRPRRRNLPFYTYMPGPNTAQRLQTEPSNLARGRLRFETENGKKSRRKKVTAVEPCSFSLVGALNTSTQGLSAH